MITAKLAALCLCPAIIATSAVIATHPKMRHAVAHVIHRAAEQIDAPSALAGATSAPCPPSYASAGPGGYSIPPKPAELTGLSPLDISPSPAAGSGGGTIYGLPGSGGPGSSGFPDGGYPSGVVGPVPTAPAGVPEPQSWALLITGFAATGMTLRTRRLVAA